MSEQNSLITNISPPTELPSFVLQQTSPKQAEAEAEAKHKFVPAIPTSTQQQQESCDETQQKANETIAEGEQATDEELPSLQDIAQALSPLTDGVKNSVLFGWVKDTVKSGMKTGVQKAKESIDKVVTTLDPQMSQLICKYKSTYKNVKLILK